MAISRWIGVLCTLAFLATPALAGDDGPGQSELKSTTPVAISYDDLMREAVSLKLKGQKDKAVEALRRASKVKPDASKPHEQMCTLLMSGKDHKAALEACQGWQKTEKSSFKQSQIKALIGIIAKRVKS